MLCMEQRPVDLEYKNLTVRLAESSAEVDAAQALRYRVFYEEMNAVPCGEKARRRRDVDKFDDFVDHLLVIDRDRSNGVPYVVGTYRLLRGAVAKRNGGFYSADEYDITNLEGYPGEIVECGRSCVDREYRSGAVMQILWRGIADYLDHYDIRLMFGCASLPGTQPEEMTRQLSYLHHNHLAPQNLRTRALEHHYVNMGRIPEDALDHKEARSMLPPLIKGYVRLGGFVGDGAVVDHQFNTTDVCVIVPTDSITEKYHRHYRQSGTS